MRHHDVIEAMYLNGNTTKEISVGMNFSGVYEIVNKVNGMIYVGSSRDVRKRMTDHLSSLRRGSHSSTHLQRAFNKYGVDAFVFNLLEKCGVSELLDKEAGWIRKKNSNDRDFGYNSRIYVDSNLGFRHSDESKELISRNRKGKGVGPRELSEDTRRAFRRKAIKQNLRQYHTEEVEEYRLERLREVIAGVPITDEHKASIGESNRGEGNGQAKLTEEKVREIKTLLSEANLTQTKIAEKYGVSRRTISMIKSGDRWGHVVA